MQEVGGLATRDEARQWSLVVLGVLADLLPEAQARRHFVSQLPGKLKSALLVEAPRGLLMDGEALVQHVGAALGTHASGGERALRAVYAVLKKAVSAGEMVEFQRRIPKDVVALLERTE